MAKFTVTTEEAIRAIRTYYGLTSSVEVEISDSDTKEVVENEWHEVPTYWKQNQAPTLAMQLGRIEVMRRNGEISILPQATDIRDCWSQDDCYLDIIKYRKA